MFSEIRASTVGSNGGGEGAEEEQIRCGEDDALTRRPAGGAGGGRGRLMGDPRLREWLVV